MGADCGAVHDSCVCGVPGDGSMFLVDELTMTRRLRRSWPERMFYQGC